MNRAGRAVMAMVAGVFLRFGLDIVFSLRDAFPIVLPSYVMPIYLKVKEEQDKAAAPVKVRKSKKRHSA